MLHALYARFLKAAGLRRERDQNVPMDIAVDLVQAYLRISGYLTVTEFEVQRKLDDGSYETATDVDIIAIRLPGALYEGDPKLSSEYRVLQVTDPQLHLEPEVVDVILGEVKEGHAEFNPGLKRHDVLHSVLRRLSWLYGDSLDEVVEELRAHGSVTNPIPSGGEVRTRLVAFGRSEARNLNTIPLTHVFERLLDYLERFESILRPAMYKDPAPAMLHLLLKTGFRVEKDHR